MAQTPISLLLLRHLSLSKPQAKPHHHLLKPHLKSLKTFFSTSTTTTTTTTQPHQIPSSQDPPKPSSLSARMSFVFDQIDAIEKQRVSQDQTLQRIRAWRQSKNNPQHQPQPPTYSINDCDTLNNTQQEIPQPEPKPNNAIDDSSVSFNESNESDLGDLPVKKKKRKEVELVHPLPEWIELMGRLVQQNYFDHRRVDEDRMVKNLGLDVSGVVENDDVGIDFSDFKTVQIACLNFGKDRFDILRISFLLEMILSWKNYSSEKDGKCRFRFIEL